MSPEYKSLTKPTPAMYSLHSLQGQATGFHFLIFLLNSKNVAFFMLVGMIDHILGPRKDIVSVPYSIVLTFLDLNGNLKQ